MDLFKKMQRLTSGKPDIDIEAPPAEIANANKEKIGTVIRGIITNIIEEDKTINKKGGYGFIGSQELPYERIFFHWSGLRQDTLRFPQLAKKMKVEFLLQYTEPSPEHDGGYRAIRIKVL